MNATFLHDVLRRIMRQTKLVRMCLDPAQCYFDTLFQDIAELSCELHAAATRHICNFDEKYAPVPSRAIGHETCDNTWTTVLLVSDLFDSIDQTDEKSCLLPCIYYSPGQNRDDSRLQSEWIWRNYLVFSAISSSYFSIPRISSISSTDSCGLYFSACPESLASAYSTAFARHTEPISRSRFRTPDSRVYDSIILDTTSWLNSTCPSPRPSIICQ